MKKKQIVLLLAVCAIGALTACSSSAGDAGKSSGSGETAANTRIRPEKGPIVILFRLFYNESVTDISSLLTETAFT